MQHATPHGGRVTRRATSVSAIDPRLATWLRRMALAGVAALPLLLQWPFLSDPLWGDEGVYSTVAHGLLDGRIPYADLFDNKPPLLYGWYAASYVLFGNEISSPRIMVGLVLSATTLLVFAQALALRIGYRGAFAAAAIFALATAVPLINSDATSESLMLLPMTASLLATTRGLRRGELRWFLVGGIAAGLAIMTKQVALWPSLALGGYVLLWSWQHFEGWRARLRPAAVLACGAAVAGVVVVLPFVLAGAFDELWDALVRFNLELGRELTWGDRLERARRSTVLFVYVLGGPLLVAIGGAIALARSRRAPAESALLWWAAGSVVAVMSSGYFHAHHYVQLFPALALLGAVLLARWPATFHSARRRRWGVALAATAVASAALGFTVVAPAYLAGTPEARHEARSFDQELTERENSNPVIGAYLRARTDPGDTIFVHGGSTQGAPIYVYADRLPATRYFFHAALRVETQRAAFTATVAALESDPPRYIVDTTLGGEVDSWAHLTPPAFWTLLEEHYVYEGRVEYADIYRLADAAPGTR